MAEHRKIRLHREELAELDSADLAQVVGGMLTPDVHTLPLNQCIILTGTETAQICHPN